MGLDDDDINESMGHPNIDLININTLRNIFTQRGGIYEELTHANRLAMSAGLFNDHTTDCFRFNA